MATATLICRVCGKKYEACHSEKHIDGVFRWKDVSCSPECGAIYLANIRASRAKANSASLDEKIKHAYDLFEAEYADESEEELFEDYCDDDEIEIEV